MDNQNVAALRAAHDAFSARDTVRADQLVASDIHFVDHGRGATLTSAAEFQGWLVGLLAMSSDMALVDQEYIAAGDWVTARFRAVGVQDRPMPPFPASGKPYSLDVCEVWRFGPDGKAVEGHNYSDGLGLLMQLGHLPALA
ncbi:MAG TPA: nuclear transport factor 2 family protein [Anaerolineae bacterium]|nr:nuclear transport factor 2 family protein [Anaerolineae bacterium]